MPRLANLPLVFGFLVWAPFVVAQSTLGELLDTGARKLSADEFKQELAQRVIVGPSPTGGTLEVIYGGNGVLQGTGTVPSYNAPRGLVQSAKISGQWTIGENGTVCTSMRIAVSIVGPPTYLPPRCQFWFKLDEKYFLSDSDTDRSAKVLTRTVKQ